MPFLLFSLCFLQQYIISASKCSNVWKRVNSLRNNKISDLSKVKVFAKYTVKVAKMMISLFSRVENLVGKGENAGYQRFLFFPQCFQKASPFGSL